LGGGLAAGNGCGMELSLWDVECVGGWSLPGTGNAGNWVFLFEAAATSWTAESEGGVVEYAGLRREFGIWVARLVEQIWGVHEV
jgi:hypothetical protein